MGKVKASTDIDSVKAEEQSRFIQLLGDDIVKQINGGLSFTDNFDCKQITVSFVLGLSQQQVVHGLGRVTNNYLVVSKSRACDVYLGTTPASINAIYLTCSVCPATVTLVVF